MTVPEHPGGVATAEPGAVGSQGLFTATYLHGQFRGSSGSTASYRLPTLATCEAVAALADRVPGFRDVGAEGTAGVRRFMFSVSPGVLRVRSTQAGLADPAGAGLDELDLLFGLPETPSAWRAPEQWDGPLPLLADAHPGRTRVGVKREVEEWSRKSRLNMARVLASLDWAGHIDSAPAGWRPQMLTLTLPADWLAVAPDGRTFKRLAERWYSRWARHFGAPWAGCWKLEFQGRGAPHLHLYGNAPLGREFARWLSLSWTGAVYGLSLGKVPADGEGWAALLARVEERHGQGVADHLRAGTGVDWAEGVRGTDPRSIGLYFLGKSVGHNLGLGKEYQHVVPGPWRAVGAGPGRFWGYRGLERVEVTRELDDVMFVRLRRLTRRWASANGRKVPAAGWSRHQGYSLLLGDAPMWLAQALRWEALSGGDTVPRGVDRETGERRLVGPLGTLP